MGNLVCRTDLGGYWFTNGLVNDCNRLGRHVVSAQSIAGFKKCWISVRTGMTGGMDECWGEKELPRVGHQLAYCSFLIAYCDSVFRCTVVGSGAEVSWLGVWARHLNRRASVGGD